MPGLDWAEEASSPAQPEKAPPVDGGTFWETAVERDQSLMQIRKLPSGSPS